MRLSWQIAFWLGAACLLGLFLWLFSNVLLPFAAALALGYLLDPVADRLERLGLNRLGATLVILVAFVLVLAVILVVLVPILGRQFASFVAALPDYVTRLQALAAQESEKLSEGYLGTFLEKVGLSGSSAQEIRSAPGDIVSQAAQWVGGLLKSVWSGGTALIGLLSLLFVTPVVAFYMLLDWEVLLRTLDGLTPPRYRPTVRELAHEIDVALAGFLRGQSLVCLFLGLWYGIGLSIVGLNFGLLIGISAGLLSFIPYVGSLTALILSASVAIVQGWPQWHLLVLAMAVVFAGQFLEGNILSPKLVGESVGLHPVWVMFALLAFGSLFGFTGLIIAVPLAAAVGVVLRFAVARYRASPLYLGEDGAAAPVLIETQAAVERRRSGGGE
jgi:predicted PurR-regulated permease PerM